MSETSPELASNEHCACNTDTGTGCVTVHNHGPVTMHLHINCCGGGCGSNDDGDPVKDPVTDPIEPVIQAPLLARTSDAGEYYGLGFDPDNNLLAVGHLKTDTSYGLLDRYSADFSSGQRVRFSPAHVLVDVTADNSAIYTAGFDRTPAHLCGVWKLDHEMKLLESIRLPIDRIKRIIEHNDSIYTLSTDSANSCSQIIQFNKALEIQASIKLNQKVDNGFILDGQLCLHGYLSTIYLVESDLRAVRQIAVTGADEILNLSADLDGGLWLIGNRGQITHVPNPFSESKSYQLIDSEGNKIHSKFIAQDSLGALWVFGSIGGYHTAIKLDSDLNTIAAWQDLGTTIAGTSPVLAIIDIQRSPLGNIGCAGYELRLNDGVSAPHPIALNSAFLESDNAESAFERLDPSRFTLIPMDSSVEISTAPFTELDLAVSDTEVTITVEAIDINPVTA